MLKSNSVFIFDYMKQCLAKLDIKQGLTTNEFYKKSIKK